MMSPSVARVAADNSAVARKYCVRVPSGADLPLPVEKRESFEGNDYCYTAAVPLSGMHKAVLNLRKEGTKVFFAAIG